MARAIELSMQNVRSGLDGPFAAVVVQDGKIIAEGSNRVTSDKDPSAHAEIVAIRAACRELDDFQLAGCEIYTTGEPCPMTCPLELYHPRFNSRASCRAPASCAKSRISFRPLQALPIQSFGLGPRRISWGLVVESPLEGSTTST